MKRVLLWLCGVLMVCAVLCQPACALEAEGETVPGMDISVYQGEVDLERSAQAGIRVVYIRAGQGDGYTDPDFPGNAAQARQAGLDFGFYYFVTATDVPTAQTQARRFAGLIRGTEYTCRPVMDFERTQDLTVQQANQVALAFLEELERQTGVLPVLYTDAYNAGHLWQAELGRYPLWVAQYGGEEPDVAGDVWSAWSGWQYTSRGRVDGIEGVVDLDRFTRRVLLTPEEQPQPQPQPGYVTYTVRWGDTLSAIAQKHRTTVAALVELNHIKNPNLILVGQRLRIPVGADGQAVYVVVRGDTLSGIAQRYNTTVAALVELNHIANPNLILVGQVLRLPVTPG